MTFEDANEAALGAVGEALKAWCRQQADALIAEGKTEAEAIAELNARLPHILPAVNQNVRQVTALLHEPDDTTRRPTDAGGASNKLISFAKGKPAPPCNFHKACPR